MRVGIAPTTSAPVAAERRAGVLSGAAAEEQVLRHLQKSAATAIVTTLDAPREGFDGWWFGGACSPHDGCLYYVPGEAKRVLKFDPATGTCELIGPELKGGEGKYATAVLGDDGKIYGIPVEAERVLRIDPATQNVDLIGESLGEGGAKWFGGARGEDNCIYCIPACAERVLRIDPKAESAECVGPSLGEGDHKYVGAVAAAGCIFGIPHNAERVLRFVVATQEVERIGESLGKGGDKWLGGETNMPSKRAPCNSCVLKLKGFYPHTRLKCGPKHTKLELNH